MKKKEAWHNLKVWDSTYRNLKILAARRGVTLAQMLDNWAAEEIVFELKEEFGGVEGILGAAIEQGL